VEERRLNFRPIACRQSAIRPLFHLLADPGDALSNVTSTSSPAVSECFEQRLVEWENWFRRPRMNAVWKGMPSIVPFTFTDLVEPKNATESAHLTIAVPLSSWRIVERTTGEFITSALSVDSISVQARRPYRPWAITATWPEAVRTSCQ